MLRKMSLWGAASAYAPPAEGWVPSRLSARSAEGRREERGRAANRKAESSSALYNSVPLRLSDAIRTFLQLEEFQWTISSATPPRVLGVHTLLFLTRDLIANQSSRRGGGRIYLLLPLFVFLFVVLNNSGAPPSP